MYKKLAFVAGVLMISAPLLATTTPGGMGVNVGYGSRLPGVFTDFQQQNYRWYKLPEWTSLTSAEVDAQGWPTCDAVHLWDYRPVNEWDATNGMDDPEGYRWDFGGTWKCSFTGQADLSAWTGEGWVDTILIQNKVYDSPSNTTTFDMVIPASEGPNDTDYGLFGLDFTNTRRTPADPVDSGFTNFKMITPGYDPATAPLFTDEWLACIASANWSTLRFMTFTEANIENLTYPDTTTWAERKIPGYHASQAGMTSTLPDIRQCGSWEYVVEAANQAGVDPWINIPVSADTDYVTQLATLIKNNLNANLNVYVESSNEVWNGGFPQYNWNAAQASALGITNQENHARRTVELAQIFESVFGAGSLNNRVRVVLCHHQPMVDWDMPAMMNYISTNFGTPSGFIWAIGEQAYFGDDTAQQGESVASILAASEQSIDDQMEIRTVWRATADRYGVNWVAYEGGPSEMGGIGTVTNVGNRILAHRDPGMEPIYEKNFDEASAALGRAITCQFTMDGAYSRYGCWGLTDDVSIPDRNWKYKAARDVLGDSTYKNGDNSPVAADDDYTTPVGQALNVSAPGVLANDTDADLDPLTAVLVKDVANGSLTLNSDGSFTYTPDAGFEGLDSFEYAPSDGTLKGNDGTVKIQVTDGYTPSTCHVANITFFWRSNGSLYVPSADVLIVDNANMPVQGADVQVSLRDGCITLLGTTDASGMAYVRALGGECHVRNPRQGGTAVGCVEDVVHATLTYAPGDNVETCCDQYDTCTGGGEPGPPGQATNPDPGNGETGVSTTATLSWTAGSGTESHDIYFGTAASPPFIQNQPETTYNPDTMAESTTYFWRIDEVNSYGTTTGVLWNFTTGAGGCVSTTMHVDSITVTAPITAPPNSIGRAEVVIVDNCGDPVSGALVSGTFTGDINESGSDTTDENGLAVIETVGTAKRPSSLTFCVDSVTDTLTYIEADNVETCDSL